MNRKAAEEAADMLEQGRSETLCGWLDLLPSRAVVQEVLDTLDERQAG